MYLGSVSVRGRSYSISSQVDVEGDLVGKTLKQGFGAMGGAIVGSIFGPVGTVVGAAIGGSAPQRSYNISKSRVISIVESKLSSYGIQERIENLVKKAIQNGSTSGYISLTSHFSNAELGLNDPDLEAAMNNSATVSVYANW